MFSKFSFVGYETSIVNIAKSIIYDVVLEEDATLLNEVAVIGYGEQKKVKPYGGCPNPAL
ncbi:MAG: hypothetical protein HC892_21995 [Saprospiraceae bacterium]|nr:hypothetical protein [Saprospiraceae bacterium]